MKRLVRLFQRIGLRIGVRCVGDGSIDGGCGYRGGVGGRCCPTCGGMLLSRGGRKSAERLQRQWDAEANAPNPARSEAVNALVLNMTRVQEVSDEETESVSTT